MNTYKGVVNKLIPNLLLFDGKNVKYQIIYKQIYTTFKNWSNSIQRKNEDLQKHKDKIMSKGLPKVKPIPGVKHIILVSSGKGGVGKTTTAVNLATALKIIDSQKDVGLLDADVFGPSIPLMMNLHDTPLLNDNHMMEPLVNYGIKCMSMGFLIPEDAPVIWRGLMVMQALEKLMRQVYWGATDYLIIDTPPGTGDTHLSIIQNLPVTGAVLVTTPQTSAVEVTKRGARMYEKMKVPIIGIVENMSHIKCPACLNEVQLFGNATENFAATMNVEILAHIPLEKEVTNSSDEGTPIVILKPNCETSSSYKKLAKKVIEFCDKTT